jgi:Lrp/AsnC family leucine-responsive transcriptional regulator
MNSGINWNIDAIDRNILNELQKDARASFAEIGRRVGLSPSAAAARVQRLEEDGVIRGYRVDIDPRAFGYNIMVFTRMLCEGDSYRRFISYIKTLDAVRECYHVTGSDALIMKILTRSIEDLNEIVTGFLPYGSPNSSVVIGDVLVRTEYDLEPARARRTDMGRGTPTRLG